MNEMTSTWPGAGTWAQPEAAVAFVDVIAAFVRSTLVAGESDADRADVDNVMMQAASMLEAWVIARCLDQPGYGAVRRAEQQLNRRLDALDGHLQQATRELLEVEQAEAAVRFQADVLTRALMAVVSHRELAGPGHRCDDGCTRELADDALVALTTAGVASERPPEQTSEAPDEPV